MKALIALKEIIVKTAHALEEGTGESISILPEGTFVNLSALTPESLISGLVNLVLMLAGIVFFFMFVIGGIKWIMSEGDKTKLDAARQQITNSLIGLAIIFVAWAIIVLLDTLFGVNLTNITLPSLRP